MSETKTTSIHYRWECPRGHRFNNATIPTCCKSCGWDSTSDGGEIVHHPAPADTLTFGDLNQGDLFTFVHDPSAGVCVRRGDDPGSMFTTFERGGKRCLRSGPHEVMSVDLPVSRFH